MTIVDDTQGVCRILSLDGGGAKGFYTLGVLKQLEATLGGQPLSDHFDVVFGTSTGAIIASLLALGKSVDEIHTLYRTHVPSLMGLRTCAGRTKALVQLSHNVYGNLKFDAMKTHVGIVSARWREERPMIFKSDVRQAHGSRATFVPGFGCTVAEAVVASCSAYPYFNRRLVTIHDGSEVELIDGGYCANNPTLFAIAEATMALGYKRDQLRVVSLGVGNYPEPPRYAHKWLIFRFFLVRLLQKTLNINTTSMETLSDILFHDVQMVRVNDSFTAPDMATDLMEHDIRKLNILYQRGTESFGKHEHDLQALLA
ncbi:patatin-like phospholipase family protein [Burkholderia cepacia]|uniref:patatin-like phospholipase family protein n=1 Tax=Burkholderia cepacia TaxID=292 RepID=UPI002AB65158|nr:patatin-like phospholipase family protein [Burkholderia cepacia]